MPRTRTTTRTLTIPIVVTIPLVIGMPDTSARARTTTNYTFNCDCNVDAQARHTDTLETLVSLYGLRPGWTLYRRSSLFSIQVWFVSQDTIFQKNIMDFF